MIFKGPPLCATETWFQSNFLFLWSNVKKYYWYHSSLVHLIQGDSPLTYNLGPCYDLGEWLDPVTILVANDIKGWIIQRNDCISVILCVVLYCLPSVHYQSIRAERGILACCNPVLWFPIIFQVLCFLHIVST